MRPYAAIRVGKRPLGHGEPFPVDNYGADSTGMIDSTTAFLNAAAASAVEGGMPGAYWLMGPGRFEVTGGQAVMATPVSACSAAEPCLPLFSDRARATSSG